MPPKEGVKVLLLLGLGDGNSPAPRRWSVPSGAARPPAATKNGVKRDWGDG